MVIYPATKHYQCYLTAILQDPSPGNTGVAYYLSLIGLKTLGIAWDPCRIENNVLNHENHWDIYIPYYQYNGGDIGEFFFFNKNLGESI